MPCSFHFNGMPIYCHPNESRIKSESLNLLCDILGHVSIQTTEVYARADSKQKRVALETV